MTGAAKTLMHHGVEERAHALSLGNQLGRVRNSSPVAMSDREGRGCSDVIYESCFICRVFVLEIEWV